VLGQPIVQRFEATTSDTDGKEFGELIAIGEARDGGLLSLQEGVECGARALDGARKAYTVWWLFAAGVAGAPLTRRRASW
jgi:hypothetical protein